MDVTYYSWGGKQGSEGSVTHTPLRLLNPYIGKAGAVATNEGGAALLFAVPATMVPKGVPGPAETDCLRRFWEQPFLQRQRQRQ